MARMISALGLIVAGLFGGFGSAHSLPSNSPSDPDIVVHGQTQKALEQFLAKAAPATHGDQVARWNQRLCMAQFNMAPVTSDPVITKFIRDRVYGAAIASHVPVARSESCSANVVIIFTDNSDALTQALFTSYTRHYQDNNNHFLTGRQIEQAKMRRPVRWLSIDGTAQGLDQNIASHICQQTHGEILSSLIIVDVNLIPGLSWGQLADYITMVALTNPTLGENFSGQNSVLALFSGDPHQAPKGLTSQDRALLSALYHTRDSYSSATQRGEMRRFMTRGAEK